MLHLSSILIVVLLDMCYGVNEKKWGFFLVVEKQSK